MSESKPMPNAEEVAAELKRRGIDVTGLEQQPSMDTRTYVAMVFAQALLVPGEGGTLMPAIEHGIDGADLFLRQIEERRPA